MGQMYTTGEIAKLAKVSVRTVQYYDKRGLLRPYQVTDGGRRLYSQAEIKQLEVITFLRQLDFSIEAIKSLLKEDKASQVLILLLNQRSQELKKEIALKKDQLDTVVKLIDSMPSQNQISPLLYLSDLSLTMKNQKTWRLLQLKLYLALLSIIIVFGCLLYLAIHFKQKWLIGLLTLSYLLITALLVKTYIDQVEYLCPNCHHLFKPGYLEFSIAAHTPKTRKLTCPYCHQKNNCLELVREKEEKNKEPS